MCAKWLCRKVIKNQWCTQYFYTFMNVQSIILYIFMNDQSHNSYTFMNVQQGHSLPSTMVRGSRLWEDGARKPHPTWVCSDIYLKREPLRWAAPLLVLSVEK